MVVYLTDKEWDIIGSIFTKAKKANTCKNTLTRDSQRSTIPQ